MRIIYPYMTNEDWLNALSAFIACDKDATSSPLPAYLYPPQCLANPSHSLCEQYALMSQIPWHNPMQPHQDLHDISKTIHQHLPLWKVKRTGWTRVIPAYYPSMPTAEQVENVAQHSYKTALLAAALCPQNVQDAYVMGLIHDIAEIQIGDIPPAQVDDSNKKHAAEREAFRSLMDACEFSNHTTQYLTLLFDAYIDNHTQVANIVHIADKLDMALQALHYESIFHIDLQEFLDSAQNVIQNTAMYESLRTPWQL